jgi:hypothetical protein
VSGACAQPEARTVYGGEVQGPDEDVVEYKKENSTSARDTMSAARSAQDKMGKLIEASKYSVAETRAMIREPIETTTYEFVAA